VHSKPNRRGYSRRRAAAVGRAASGLEALEQRRLLSVSLINGGLTVDGTPDNDVIQLTVEDGELVVDVNGVQDRFAVETVTGILVRGHAGDDAITLGAGVIGATLNGGAGNDTLAGGSGNDTLIGEDGDDHYVFRNGWGEDLILEVADGGSDTLDFSAADRDLLFTIGPLSVTDGTNVANHGEGEVENLIGGSANDAFYLFNDGASVVGFVDGGPGINTLVYTNVSVGISVNLAEGTATGAGGITRISNVIGGLGDDLIIGDSLANTLQGGPGNDTLIGGGGDDVFIIGNDPGIDQIISEGGTFDFSARNTPLRFDIGLDGFTVSSGGQTIATGGNNAALLRGGSADDVFAFADGAQFAGTLDGHGGINTLDYSAYTTPVVVRLAGAIGATATGGIANFTNIMGGAANDILVGNAAPNLILGMGGNDRISGGAGNDTIRGGAGNDVIKGADGDDLLRGDAGNDIIYGGRGNDTLAGAGGNDKLYGDAGNDLIRGGAGNDTIVGGPGLDRLYGDAGNDVINARDGARDAVAGGPGFDRARHDPGLDRIGGVEELLA